MVTTRKQREAFKRLFDRCPIYPISTVYGDGFTSIAPDETAKPVNYRQFRRGIIMGHDCAMVRWCGMWLGIEQDGYTHS